MSPIQQMFLGLGAATKTYAEDLFSTYLYRGNGSSQSINNGVKLSDGGLVWVKVRSQSNKDHELYDTVRGATKLLKPSGDYGNQEQVTDTASLTSFNANGFSVGSHQGVNQNNDDIVSWSFKKQKGFLDILEYTGNGSNSRTISHSLGSNPGFIIWKRTDDDGHWIVWHRDFYYQTSEIHPNLRLNGMYGFNSLGGYTNNITPTSSILNIPIHNNGANTADSVNVNGAEYVAYVFAGGESEAATAASIRNTQNTQNHYIYVNHSSDFDISTGDWTIECFVKQRDGGGVIFSSGKSGNSYEACMFYMTDQTMLQFYSRSTSAWIITDDVGRLAEDCWHHIAATREGNMFRFFVDGILKFEEEHNVTLNSPDGSWRIGGRDGSSAFRGSISNFRYTKGQALYTDSFLPPTEPLTTTSQGATASNVKLLCCNSSSSVTGSTVVSGTLQEAGSNWSAHDGSPFDDKSAYIFGDNEDQSMIKTGSYRGFWESSVGPTIEIGWEPQFLLVKAANTNEHWEIYDSTRGIHQFGQTDRTLEPNLQNDESNNDRFEITPTGFKVVTGSGSVNSDGDPYMYVAIRRPDGLVGKPIEAGTDAFAMDTGDSSDNISTSPAFDSGFVVDMALNRQPGGSSNWMVTTRLTKEKHVEANETGSYGSQSKYRWDSNSGWSINYANTVQSWMWKRHAGFDVVGHLKLSNKHNLGRTPEMVWIKRWDNSCDWFVWHKDLNGGGSNSIPYHLHLNTTAAQVSSVSLCPIGDTLPTATHFKTPSDSDIRNDGSVAFLFASVSGFSKVGSYSGSGSTGNAQNIGFQPRFLMIKRINSTGDWMQFNSVGGFGNYMQLNTTQQQYSQTYVSVSSTGFSLVSDYGDTNESGSSYIYYAHA